MKNTHTGKYIRIIAIDITPANTVTDKLFVHIAKRSVGIKANTTDQLREVIPSPGTSKFSTTSALKIHIGMKESHFITMAGSFTCFTKRNGIILGSHVTIAQPIIVHIIIFILIDPSPPQ